jgi:DNA-binding LacI/PurR family transcriptional regulator
VTPPLTTVVQSTSAIAATAVELLLDQLHEGRANPRQVELPVVLEVRGSSAPPPPGA